ncbi:hypothetical protein ACN4EK_32470 [Pantanalinema rosaneae CENA516]|uniref:hypothetical protein n=1 Tax=Pantanalinema rosaneae TaxID=1620701 RepID=UPI003D6F04A1
MLTRRDAADLRQRYSAPRRLRDFCSFVFLSEGVLRQVVVDAACDRRVTLIMRINVRDTGKRLLDPTLRQ